MITIGTDDIGGHFGSKKERGPFLVISRACGMALDTADRNEDGAIATVHPTNAARRQLWYLRPSGHAGEVLIISADNGMALDAGRPSDEVKPLLWEPHGADWQRWTLTPSPDGAAYYIGSVGHGRTLVMNQDAEPNWQPWLEDREGIKAHQWMLAVPHGNGLT